MPIVSPDQVNRQKQMLEDAAMLAQEKAGLNLEYDRRSKGERRGTKRQLVVTVLVIAAVVAVLILLSRLGAL